MAGSKNRVNPRDAGHQTVTLESLVSSPVPRTISILGMLGVQDDQGLKNISFEHLAHTVVSLNPEARAELVSESESVLRSSPLRKSESVRVLMTKLVSALLPDSLTVIRELLLQKRNRHDFEVHFSLFCFLDQVLGLGVGEPTVRAVLRTVEEYLLGVQVETALAAWMAGDLLGDHWRPEEALDSLRKVLSDGRHVAGREAAIHGLEQLHARLPANRRKQASIAHVYGR